MFAIRREPNQFMLKNVGKRIVQSMPLDTASSASYNRLIASCARVTQALSVVNPAYSSIALQFRRGFDHVI
ncbi:hypothetical protein TUM12370_00870 [Salmonella enterica subsp. enterica serovar Choleraesuis]|nr:hypothetical protein TUM12370_00870 [Salmonella enterica subsp. enterica serovar Choleraesuis]